MTVWVLCVERLCGRDHEVSFIFASTCCAVSFARRSPFCDKLLSTDLFAGELSSGKRPEGKGGLAPLHVGTQMLAMRQAEHFVLRCTAYIAIERAQHPQGRNEKNIHYINDGEFVRITMLENHMPCLGVT